MSMEVSKHVMESAYKDVERDALARTTAQDKPVAIVLGGQPGSGKSALAAGAIQELRANGGAVVIDADRMREENPRYKQLSRQDPQHAADRTQKEAGEWAGRLTRAAVDNRRNLVVDGTMRSPENIRNLTNRLMEQGYKVEARVLAVNPETSVTRARLRFEEQVAERGTGRFVNKEQHDNAYAGITSSVRALESEKLAHSVRLYNANQRLIYENSQEHGEWKKQPAAAEILMQERGRPWTHAELRDYVSALEDINTLAKQREGSRAYADALLPEHERSARSVISDQSELAAKLDEARKDLDRFVQTPTYQRAQAFEQLTKREALERHPELDGAYKQLHEIRHGEVPANSHDRQALYTQAHSELSAQLHRGHVPIANVTLDESRQVIDMAAAHRGFLVRDAQELKQDVKGEVVAVSSHHALVKMSDMVAVRYEKDGLNRELAVGEKVAIQHASEKSQVYEPGKEPARESGRDMGREIDR